MMQELQCTVAHLPCGAKVNTDLFNKDGEALVFKGFREFNVLSSFIVYRQWSHNHVSQASQELSHHAIPLFLVTVVYLKSQNKEGAIANQQCCRLCHRMFPGVKELG